MARVIPRTQQDLLDFNFGYDVFQHCEDVLAVEVGKGRGDKGVRAGEAGRNGDADGDGDVGGRGGGDILVHHTPPLPTTIPPRTETEVTTSSPREASPHRGSGDSRR